MPTIDLTVECPVHRSFRTAQVAGMFDVPLSEKLRETFSADVPSEDDDWRIGLIVGPSGSGKSTVARAAFGDRVWRAGAWPAKRAIVDCFGELPTKQIVGTLTAVGFSSPPSWVKPFSVLSNGEQFRCELARALLGCSRQNQSTPSNKETRSEPPDRRSTLVCFDEFTSVVDRNVARVCSAAVAKAIRSGRVDVRFVAVTCHDDVAEWLAPDWILDMATGEISRRRLRRPPIDLAIYRAELSAWKRFAKHHYLSGSLAPQARCYVAVWKRPSGARMKTAHGTDSHGPTVAVGEAARQTAVAFAATLPVIGRKGHRRFTRIVTLPDYQGVGIGMATTEAVAAVHRDEGLRINVTSSHPSLIAHCRRSQKWRCIGVKKRGSSDSQRFQKGYKSSLGRAVVSFEFFGEGCSTRKQKK